jgi:predicted ATPase
VFVGRNDQGKSSLLDALSIYGSLNSDALARLSSRDPDLYEAALGAVFTAIWHDRDSGRTYTHEIICDVKEPRERLSWFDNECEWDSRGRKLICNKVPYSAKGVRRYSPLGALQLADWQTETEVPDEINEGLATVGRFTAPTPYLFEPSRLALGVPLDVETVYRSGAGWVILLQALINRRDGSLEELEKNITELFPFFSKVFVVEERWEVQRTIVGLPGEASGMDRQTSSHGFDLAALAENQSERRLRFEVKSPRRDRLIEGHEVVPASAMSSGLLLALAYFTVAIGNPAGSLLALEEPENGLNSVIALDMMERFLKVIHEREHQLLMTTHNEFWLDLVPDEAIRVVTRNEEGSHIHADPETARRIREEGLYLSEVMSQGGPEQLLEKRRGNE